MAKAPKKAKPAAETAATVGYEAQLWQFVREQQEEAVSLDAAIATNLKELGYE